MISHALICLLFLRLCAFVICAKTAIQLFSFFILCQMSLIGIALISCHPMYVQANIINKKNANITANAITANVAIKIANKLSIVSSIFLPCNNFG